MISKKRLTVRIIFWALSIAVMGLIFLFSAQVGTDSAKTSGGFITFILRVFYPNFATMDEASRLALVASLQLIVRKGAHFSVYALLGLCTGCAALTYTCRRWVRLAVPFAVCLAWAISDEIHQYFVPSRACAALDVLIDSCGAALGVAVSVLFIGYLFRKHITNKSGACR